MFSSNVISQHTVQIEKDATTLWTNFISKHEIAKNFLSSKISKLEEQVSKTVEEAENEILAELEKTFQAQDENFVMLQNHLKQIRANLDQAKKSDEEEIAKNIGAIEREFEALSATAYLEPCPSPQFHAIIEELEKAKEKSLFYVRKLAIDPKNVSLQPEAVMRPHSKGGPIVIVAKVSRGKNNEDCPYLERFLQVSVIDVESGAAVGAELKSMIELENDQERQTGVRISFLPPGRGLYEVSVSLCGEPVKNSPIKVKIEQKRQRI